MWRAFARQKGCWALSGAALLCTAAVFLSGCGVTGRATARAPGHTVQVTERDFDITGPTQLPAGRVRLTVRNGGPDAHELIVARVGGGAPLPLRRDGLTVDEERIQAATVGKLEPGAPKSVREVTVNLTPGRYVLFCNMYGHYRGGMHSELVVN